MLFCKASEPLCVCASEYVCIKQKGLSQSDSGILTMLICTPWRVSASHTHTHMHTLGGRPSSEEGALFYQHKSHQVIRHSTTTVETGGNCNRWWNGASVKKSHNTHNSHMQECNHMGSQSNSKTHITHTQRDSIRKSAANQNNLTGMMTGLSNLQPLSPQESIVITSHTNTHTCTCSSCSSMYVYL